ncbi:MAG TPA: hypothetical protein QF597_06045, partial [Arenicellales bacterium]|nr:hypothetical protein [Arenicellales bacterium]
MRPYNFLGRMAMAGCLSVALPSVGIAAKKYTEIDVVDGGSIAGRVTFEGELPIDAIDKISITKNIDVCDDEGTGYREVVWVDVK